MNRLALALALALSAADAPEQDRTLAEAAERIAEAHREADALEKKGELTAAVDVLVQARQLPLPEVEDAWHLKADLSARASQLALGAGDVEGATTLARRGLDEAAGKPASIYGSQLWLRLGEALEAAKDDDGAVNAYQSAIDVAKAALAARQDAGRGP